MKENGLRERNARKVFAGFSAAAAAIALAILASRSAGEVKAETVGIVTRNAFPRIVFQPTETLLTNNLLVDQGNIPTPDPNGQTMGDLSLAEETPIAQSGEQKPDNPSSDNSANNRASDLSEEPSLVISFSKKETIPLSTAEKLISDGWAKGADAVGETKFSKKYKNGFAADIVVKPSIGNAGNPQDVKKYADKYLAGLQLQNGSGAYIVMPPDIKLPEGGFLISSRKSSISNVISPKDLSQYTLIFTINGKMYTLILSLPSWRTPEEMAYEKQAFKTLSEIISGLPSVK